ncbi:MAG TPA: uL15 family ribosomal protein [Candidatus Nitrosotalea sp.]|jgi:large subunit ribosomal protein L15|uniref:uL15 family ribosomal protein n=1 Tax=Candidatus Nitrosotalea sp. FS TaxID=2341021 RepID=UPI0014088858|nr:uL15 family ribosomal protein [Candidatus Nitrosotalea sp. FS]NHH98702.1 LSU ribosomal protein L27Ae (L15p) [Candidatus Nitrosotalea sp. FS]HEU5221537.1 uL15 family ribosomal protein [Candidatus Nitrosotalea sp.]HEX5359032.1 uL15 family ribosomal protein [Candidatus Nitrosotalea sp.]
MPTRARKTRKYRGSRHCGWGQIGQHRASGHKGGLGQSGLHKHHFIRMLMTDPKHFGHDSTHPPHPNLVRKWASVRDLDDIFAKFGKQEGGKKLIDLTELGYDKLLGGGQTENAYVVKVEKFSASAEEKVKQSGGEVQAVA